MSRTAWAPGQEGQLLARLPVLAVAGFLFAVGFRLFPSTASSVLGVVTVFTCYVLAFLMMSWALVGNPDLRMGAIVTAGAFLLGVVASIGFGILVEIPTYGTDVLSFAHASAEGLLDGRNPYELTIEGVRPVLDSIGYNDALATPTVSQPLERLLYYPAGHVLYFVPYLAAGINDLRWATLAVELATLGFIWWVVTPSTRVLLPLVVLMEPYLATIFTSGGNSDWLWVLPLSVAAYLLHRGELSWAGLWLGFACAMKQQPWFVVPFMLIYGLKTHSKTNVRGLASMVAMLGAGFLLPNLPFILWDTGEWFEGVLGPLLLDLAPAGQGISLLTSQGWLDLSKTTLNSVMVIAAAAAIIGYWRYFPRARNLLWVLPAAILFFAHRSLHSYFVYWIPIALLWIDLEFGDFRSSPSTRTPTVAT